MIVLDASVLIAYLDGDDGHHEAAERLLAGAIDDDLAANALTLAEVLVVPVRGGRLRPVQTALRHLNVNELAPSWYCCPPGTATGRYRVEDARMLRPACR